MSLRLAPVLLLATVLVACGGSPVAIRTSTDGSCYLMGVTGDLVTDAESGAAIVDSLSGRRIALIWPAGWTARSSMFGVEIIDRRGDVAFRTGAQVNLAGGYLNDGSFLVCGLELIQ